MQDYIIVIPVRAATPIIASDIAGLVSDEIPFDHDYPAEVLEVKHPIVIPRAATDADYADDAAFMQAVTEYVRDGYNNNALPNDFPTV